MSRYIKLDTAIEHANQLYHGDEVEAWLESLPTIDIVHCQECEHGEYREDFDNYLCDQLGLGVVNDADFFCSDGERRDNE